MEVQELKENLSLTLERLTKHAVNDTAYQKVHEAVKGCKTPHNLPTSHPAQAFKSQWDTLSTDLTLPHLLLYHGRIVVPEVAKKEVMKTLPCSTLESQKPWPTLDRSIFGLE